MKGATLIHYNDQEPFELTLSRLAFSHKPLYTAVLLGGGTLIFGDSYLPAVRKAAERNLPLFSLGTGVRDPTFWQPQDPADYTLFSRRQTEWISVLKEFRRITVRGPRSADCLEHLGLTRPEIVGDPGLLISRDIDTNRPKTGVIGISLHNANDRRYGRSRVTYEALQQFIPIARKLDLRFRLLALAPDDEQTLCEFAAGCDIAIEPPVPLYRNIDQGLESLESCDVIIGERLHAVVAALALCVPSICLAYQPKAIDFMESMGLQDYCIENCDLTASLLLEKYMQIDSTLDKLRREIADKAEHYRKKQLQILREITNIACS